MDRKRNGKSAKHSKASLNENPEASLMQMILMKDEIILLQEQIVELKNRIAIYEEKMNQSDLPK